MAARVLLVEDDEILREVYATKLTMEGFVVEVARDGQEGLAMAELREPDIILLDMIMPRLTGLEFLQKYQLRTKHPKVRLVVMSNKSSLPEINQAKLLGASEYLIKSQYTPEQIVAKVRHYLQQG